MTISTDLSKVLDSLLRDSRRGLQGSSSLLRTLDTVWYGSPSRQKGCFFRLNDDAFDVPELEAFRQFALELRKTPLQMTNGFAILDYSLPRFPEDYTNAIYLLLDEARDREIELYARRLTGLYHYKVIGDRIFDSNKVILSHPHYENFILSRAASKSDRIDDEYFIDLVEMEKHLRDLLNGEMENLFKQSGGEYLEALAAVYEKIRSEPCRSKIPEMLKTHCSPLVCDVVVGKPQIKEIGGQVYEDIQSAFVTYLVFFLSIMPSSPEEFVYFPVQMVAGSEQTLRWVGGILLPLLKTSNREQRVALRSAVQVIVSSFYSAYTDALLLKSLEGAAQAQIMSRNMSHNIGSHALARIKASDMRNAPEDSERLLGYLQERMDFVARVATEWPAWREPVLFYADLIHGFLKQGLLLNNLVADDGYEAAKHQIEFRVQLPIGEAMLFSYAEGDATGDDRHSEFRRPKVAEMGGEPSSDLLVSIPGGPVGRQAFYGFLENAIRNAAKHNPGCQPLRVALELAECRATDGSESKFYRLKYKDSVSLVDSGADLVARVRSNLLEDLVNSKSRKPIDHAWGLQEMKLYARYLAHPFENEKDDPFIEQQEGHLLWAKGERFLDDEVRLPTENVKNQEDLTPNTDEVEVLSYTLGLQRPCLALVVGSQFVPADEETRRRYGLETLEGNWERLSPKLLHHTAPALLYFVQTLSEEDEGKFLLWLKDNKRTLPARTLIRPASNLDGSRLRSQLRQIGLSNRVRVDCDPAPLVCELQDSPRSPELAVQGCLLDLYRRWLIAACAERGFDSPFNIIIYFDRDRSPYPQRWANLRQSASTFRLDDILNVFPIGKHNTHTSVNLPNTVTLEPWKVVTRSWDDVDKRFLDSLSVGQGGKGTWLVFDNHRRGKPHTVSPKFYQYLGAHSDDATPHPNNREAFDRMTNVPEGFAGLLSLLQLVEACLLRVLVLDERVAALALELERTDQVTPGWRLTWKKSKEGTEYGDKVTSQFGEAGICFSPFVDVVHDDEVNHICLLHSEGTVRWLNHEDGDLFPSITLNGSEVTHCVALGVDGNPSAERIPSSIEGGGPFFDVVIVHKGLLEWLSESVADHFNSEVFLESLHQLGARVILTSGRGAQIEGSPARYPFVEFAVLESYLVRELSKASLANVLMAVTGQERQQ